MRLLTLNELNELDIADAFQYYFSSDTSNHKLADTLLDANFSPAEIQDYADEHFGEACKLSKTKWRELITKTSLNTRIMKLYSVKSISNLTNLTKLYLDNSNIGNIAGISKLINLNTVVLMDNNISDISESANLTKLETLLLNNTNVSDIKPLSRLHNLKYLDLSGSKVSQSDILELRRNLPKCNIIY